MKRKSRVCSNLCSCRTSLLRRIPRHVWIILEVITTLLVLHYAHISITDFLQILKVLAA